MENFLKLEKKIRLSKGPSEVIYRVKSKTPCFNFQKTKNFKNLQAFPLSKMKRIDIFGERKVKFGI